MRTLRKFPLVGLAAPVVALMGSASAEAHLDLLSPPARAMGQEGDGTQLKNKPCGQSSNARTTDRVTKLQGGRRLDILIKEYIDHPGYFAVAFDPDGDDSFPFPRAGTDLLDVETDDPKAQFPVDGKSVLGVRADKDGNCAGENAEHTCSIPITVPNLSCRNCTLQVTQMMYDSVGDHNEANDLYYQCADIEIEQSESETSDTNGCSFSSAPRQPAAIIAALGLALALLGWRRSKTTRRRSFTGARRGAPLAEVLFDPFDGPRRKLADT
jgi:MYXO-CTERM domain-containing protein